MGKVSNSTSQAESPVEEEFKHNPAVYVTHKRRGSNSAESDDSILPRHKGIMRTTEVEVR